MLKKFAAGFILLTLLIAIAVGSLWSGAGHLVKVAIEQYGSQITGTKVHVDSVHLSLSTGEGTISGLTIANPQGFSSHNALEMGSISIHIDTHSLMENGPITVQSIAVEAPHVAFEGQGLDNNLQAIERHARGYSHNEAVQASNNMKQERRLIISDLDIRGGQLSISHAQLRGGQTFTVPMSEIHLQNIGKTQDGATPAEVAEQLITTISQSAIQDANANLTKSLESIRPGLDKGMNGLKNLLGR